MFKKVAAFFACVAVVSAFSCSFIEESKEKSPTPQAAPKAMSMKEASPAEGAAEMLEGKAVERGIEGSVIGRKVIYTAYMSIEVKDYDESFEKIKEIVEGVNGFISNSRTYEEADGRKYGDITLKVPQASFDDVIASLSKIGKVRELSQHGQDVTEEYFDLDARLKNAKRMEERLKDLLDKSAGRLKDMLEVEKELSRVREEIERFEGKKRFLDSRIELSTITVNLFEPLFYSRSIFDPVADALKTAGRLFMRSLGNVVKFISAALPWIVLVFGFFWFVFKAMKRWWKRFKEKTRQKTLESVKPPEQETKG